ncbi:MAG: VOC family protein [Proteobacteria bacterium]|nr:VOC family protein [Pseudomonadota bacterium]
MISRIDHISIAVKHYEKARHFFQHLFGAIPGAGDINHEKKYFWQIFSLGDLSRLELIHPTGPKGLLEKYLGNKDGGVHHISLQTPDIQKARQKLEDHGVPYFGYNEYGDFWKEIFIHPRDAFGVLIQIAEFNPDDWLDKSKILPKKQKWGLEKTETGCTLSVAHPGGGKVKLELTAAQIRQLIQELDQYC